MTGINDCLKAELQEFFEGKGIVAYSACCNYHCSGSYNENNDDFVGRKEPGIFFIKIYLDGMNYHQEVTDYYANYDSYNYVIENWEQEKDLLAEHCRILGLQPNEYKIQQPQPGMAIRVELLRPLVLEEPIVNNFH